MHAPHQRADTIFLHRILTMLATTACRVRLAVCQHTAAGRLGRQTRTLS